MFVVLFEFNRWSITGWLIRLVTGSIYSHAGILMHNGLLYDASESVGRVSCRGMMSTAFGKRQVLIYPVNVNPAVVKIEIDNRLGTKYDYKGILGYMFAKQDSKKMYCFEFIWSVLDGVGRLPASEDKNPGKVSANDLLRIISGASYVGKANEWR